MFHKESIRIVLVAMAAFVAVMMLAGEVSKRTEYQYQYKIGECAWHIHQSKNPDGTHKRNIFKIIGTIELEGKPYYITDVINWHYRFDHFSPKLASADYYDKYHPSKTRKEKCINNLTKEASKECLENEDYEFTTGGMECPTKEQYCKELKEKTGEECWKKK